MDSVTGRRAGGPRLRVPAADRDSAVAEVRALVRSVARLEYELADAVQAARAAGVDSIRLSGALGVDRSTLYRRFPVTIGDGAAGADS